MAALLRSADELMAQYAAYHRDRRNIASHFVGIPMIVFSIGVLLARPAFTLAGVPLTPAWVLVGLSTLWYLTRGEPVLGIAVSVLNAVLVAAATPIGAMSTAAWLAWGVGTFVVGWIIQAVGHVYEGRKPAFVDDVIGLLTGPMFVTAEALFALGWNPALLQRIEAQAGPPRAGTRHETA